MTIYRLIDELRKNTSITLQLTQLLLTFFLRPSLSLVTSMWLWLIVMVPDVIVTGSVPLTMVGSW